MASFDQFDLFTLMQIFRHVSINQRLRLRTLCRKVRIAIDSIRIRRLHLHPFQSCPQAGIEPSDLFVHLFDPIWNDDRFLNIQHLSICLNQRTTEPFTLRHLNRLKQLVSLKLSQIEHFNWPSFCSTLPIQSLQVGGPITTSRLVSFPNLIKLKCDQLQIDSNQINRKLIKLSIAVYKQANDFVIGRFFPNVRTFAFKPFHSDQIVEALRGLPQIDRLRVMIQDPLNDMYEYVQYLHWNRRSIGPRRVILQFITRPLECCFSTNHHLIRSSMDRLNQIQLLRQTIGQIERLFDRIALDDWSLSPIACWNSAVTVAIRLVEDNEITQEKIDHFGQIQPNNLRHIDRIVSRLKTLRVFDALDQSLLQVDHFFRLQHLTLVLLPNHSDSMLHVLPRWLPRLAQLKLYSCRLKRIDLTFLFAFRYLITFHVQNIITSNQFVRNLWANLIDLTQFHLLLCVRKDGSLLPHVSDTALLDAIAVKARLRPEVQFVVTLGDLKVDSQLDWPINLRIN